MGQEQSTSQTGASSSPSDIPYTSYSVEKTNIKSKTLKNKSTLDDIYVVSEGQRPHQNIDEDLKNLQLLQHCKPVLRASVQASTPKEFESLERFDLTPLLKLCTRYEDHLRQCAEAVSFDQDMLSSRIKEVDVNCAAVMSAVSDRYRRLVHVSAHLKKVQEMSQTLRRLDFNIKRIIPMMDRLNNLLPEDEKLEPFNYQPTYDIQSASSFNDKL
ncbi:BLOC-1-related complex subunit 5 [Exaiptasia diaphana]|uniref:BLOC-1-related complex subunit 5 n=1 Tax=Exaiptasia diaphana TaxID=2652724 RepID=A0A913XY94_EXADI|nr:BLOC-1-related complex subunit 5 [Exaiptasia diaphana]